jgi:transposase
VATQGSPLTPELKRAIVLLKDYFDRTQDDVREQDYASAERAAHALGVGIATVKRVMADFHRSPEVLDRGAAQRRGRPPRAIADSLQTMTRDSGRQANREGTHMTLEMGAERLAKEAPAQQCSLRTLGRTLERWGFTCGKGTRSQHLKEKDQVVAARQRSLRQKRANRQGDAVIRPEVYLDESYVKKKHRNDVIWYCDEDGPWVQKPTGKGDRLIMLHAMTKSGWVPGAKLTFKSPKKTGDSHGQMHHDLFTKWFPEQLLPTIPGNALILMDTAPYHTVLSRHSAPTATCTKDSIYTWFSKQGLPMRDDCLKAELVEMLAKLAPAPPYALDELAAEHGHEI